MEIYFDIFFQSLQSLKSFKSEKEFDALRFAVLTLEYHYTIPSLYQTALCRAQDTGHLFTDARRRKAEGNFPLPAGSGIQPLGQEVLRNIAWGSY